jgi:predicted nucleotide-binding protein
MAFGETALEDAMAALKELVQTGEGFTYENFSSKSGYGYPTSYTPNWLAWRARVSGIITKLFGEGTAQADLIRSAERVKVIGNGEDKYDQAKAYYMAALHNAINVLEKDTFNELIAKKNALAPQDLTNKVFVVHGHDAAAKNELETLLREMGLEPIVLHRKADEGSTIIEKFEKHADVGFAFILMTPDEVAFLAKDQNLPESERKSEFRARPNVIFEFGYFVGRIGRNRTCCIYSGDVTVPSDLAGLLYKKYTNSIEEVAYSLQKELRAAGYELKA